MAKGLGSYSWTMTMFYPTEQALKDFSEALKHWINPPEEKVKSFGMRIRFKVEWAENEKAAVANDKYLAKNKPTFNGERIVNPLKDYLK